MIGVLLIMGIMIILLFIYCCCVIASKTDSLMDGDESYD